MKAYLVDIPGIRRIDSRMFAKPSESAIRDERLGWSRACEREVHEDMWADAEIVMCPFVEGRRFATGCMGRLRCFGVETKVETTPEVGIAPLHTPGHVTTGWDVDRNWCRKPYRV